MIEEEVFAIASRYLKRARRGGNSEVSAVCPFHRKSDGSEERQPSFTLNLSKGVFYCHRCHEAGNFQKFLRNVGISHTVLANQYQPLLDGLAKHRPTSFNPIKPKGVHEQEPIPEAVLGFFDHCPVALVDPDMKLDEDDPVFDESVLQRMDIGFDQKHMRITFPLRDLHGELLGISGRTVAGEFPRYKIYDTEYKDFDLPVRQPPKKSGLLWNAHNVYNSVYFGPRDSYVIVVEGFKACLWLVQAGFPNTVAMIGSSLSAAQKWILERMGARVYLMLDNDAGGRDGLLKTGNELKKSLDVFVVNYATRQPTGLSLEAVQDAVNNNTEDYYRWVIRKREQERQHGIRQG